MATSPVIRQATEADIPRLVEIRASVRENQLRDPSRVTPADYVWFIAQSDIWLWTDDGTILGFAAGDPRDGSIWALFIDPGHEGRGIGRHLLERACQTVRSAGFDKATLTTGPGTRAERFYREGGWAETGRSPRGETVFERQLGNEP